MNSCSSLTVMLKKLCACGCGDMVTQKVELHHINVLAPAVLASQVLNQNRRLIKRKKRSKAIGFHAAFHEQLVMDCDADDNDDVALPADNPADEDIYMDHPDPGPSSLRLSDDDDPVAHHSPVVMEDVDRADCAGPSDLTHDDLLLLDPPYEDFFMDDPAPTSSFPNDDASIRGNIDSDVYGLSNLRWSRQIAGTVEKIGQQRWGTLTNAPVQFVNNREESDEEEELEEDADDDEFETISDFNVAGDEEDEEDEDEMFAGPGQEGVSLWDSLGEGFLREVSQLGIYTSFWYFLKFFS